MCFLFQIESEVVTWAIIIELLILVLCDHLEHEEVCQLSEHVITDLLKSTNCRCAQRMNEPLGNSSAGTAPFEMNTVTKEKPFDVWPGSKELKCGLQWFTLVYIFHIYMYLWYIYHHHRENIFVSFSTWEQISHSQKIRVVTSVGRQGTKNIQNYQTTSKSHHTNPFSSVSFKLQDLGARLVGRDLEVLALETLMEAQRQQGQAQAKAQQEALQAREEAKMLGLSWYLLELFGSVNVRNLTPNFTTFLILLLGSV